MTLIEAQRHFCVTLWGKPFTKQLQLPCND